MPVQMQDMQCSADSLRARSRELVSDHPLSAALTAFGVGLGMGVVLCSVLIDGSSHSRSAGVAERLGRQVIDALGRALPESLTSRFG